MADRYWWPSGGTGSSTGNWASTTNWSSSSASYVAAAAPTLADNANFGSYSGSVPFTVTVAAAASCADLVINNANMTLAGTASWTIYGSVAITSFAARTYNGPITFSATSIARTLNFGAMSLASTLTFNQAGGVTWTLGSALATSQQITLTNGTLNTSTSNYSLTCGGIALGIGTKALVLNASAVTVTLNIVFNINTAGFTFNAGSSAISFVSVSARTLFGAGLTFYNLIQGGAGALTISGSNTFNNISNSVQPATVIFASASTNKFSNFNLNGTAGNLVTIRSSVAGTRANLVKTGADVSCDYLNIKDIAAA